MKLEYIKPELNVVELDTELCLAATSTRMYGEGELDENNIDGFEW